MNKRTNQNWLSISLVGLFLTLLLNPSLSLSQPTIEVTSGITKPCNDQDIEQAIDTFKDPWQKRTAALYLIDCGLTATPALARVLQIDPNAGIRETAAMTLGSIGGAVATKALIDSLQTDSATTVRKTAADALGFIRAKSAINLLIVKLQQPNEDISVRQAAAEALGAIGDATAINPLMNILKNTHQPLDLRLANAKALVQMGESAINVLVTALKDPDLRTQYWAVVALTEIKSPRALDALRANQTKATQILEAAYKADIVEFDRVPVNGVDTRRGIVRKPIVCKIEWIAQHWSRCR